MGYRISRDHNFINFKIPTLTEEIILYFKKSARKSSAQNEDRCTSHDLTESMKDIHKKMLKEITNKNSYAYKWTKNKINAFPEIEYHHKMMKQDQMLKVIMFHNELMWVIPLFPLSPSST